MARTKITAVSPAGMREGYTRTERVGPWVVEAWWPVGSRGGPREMKVYPAEDAQPSEAARGISTRTLADIPLARMTLEYAEVTPAMDDVTDMFKQEIEAGSRQRGRSPLFFAQVAEEYAKLSAQGERTPVAVMARRTGKSTDAVRQWVKLARRQAFLTGQPGKAGGELTDKARALLERVESVTAALEDTDG